MPLRLLLIGAHPDDAEFAAGGLAAIYRQAGHVVKMVSMTEGGAGHHILKGPELIERRKAEAAASAAIIGAESENLDIPDGGVLPSLENREKVIRLIRTFQPDLLLTHRPNDYHPDHRYTSILVQDAAYMVTVPAVVPDVPHLRKDPVIAYLYDDFRKPVPFEPSVIIDTTPVLDNIIDMLHCHESQVYEWLPYNWGVEAQIPECQSKRKEWLRNLVLPKFEARAERFRGMIESQYGLERAAQVKTIEAVEACEYGANFNEETRLRLFSTC